MKVRKHQGITLELAKEVAAKEAARLAEQAAFDAEMMAIDADAEAFRFDDCTELHCEMCGKQVGTIDNPPTADTYDHDANECADCSASWDDYCAMEYGIFLAEWEARCTGDDWREILVVR